MNAISKNVYINKLLEILKEYKNTTHKIIMLKLAVFHFFAGFDTPDLKHLPK